MQITRSQVIQQLLSLHDVPRYLEVGVANGETFHAVNAVTKVAVDPRFRFSMAERQSDAEYHEVTSDDYFGSIVDRRDRFHVIYLDGLHTAEQTLRDFINAISYLAEGGMIVIDDVCPPTQLSAIPDRRTFFKVREFIGSDKQTWMGDVFKIVYFIDTFCQQFSYRVIAENHGQAVVWPSRRKHTRHRSVTEVGGLTFENMVVDADPVLKRTPFSDILAEIQKDHA